MSTNNESVGSLDASQYVVEKILERRERKTVSFFLSQFVRLERIKRDDQMMKFQLLLEQFSFFFIANSIVGLQFYSHFRLNT